MAKPLAPRRQRAAFARTLRALGLALLALSAVLGVAVALFPFERLAPALASRLERETGVATRIESLRATIGLRGPELAARGVTLRWPGGAALALDALRVRPARPSAWLRGVPTAHVALSAPFGGFEGEVSNARVSGELARFDLAELPPAWFGGGGAPLAGAVDAHVELERSGGAWAGNATLSGGEGSLALPGSPIAIPYERVDGAVRLDAAGMLQVESLAIAGPMVSASARGSIGAGPTGPASGAIAIEADLERLDPTLLPALAQYGIALDAKGAGRVSISGTAGRLEMR